MGQEKQNNKEQPIGVFKKMKKQNKKKMLLAGAVAGLLAITGLTSAAAVYAETACSGVNSCKGTGACAGKANTCAGQNSCKGAGWMKVESDAKCMEMGGTVATPAH